MFDGGKKTENNQSSSARYKTTYSVGIALGGIAVALAGVMAYRYRLL